MLYITIGYMFIYGWRSYKYEMSYKVTAVDGIYILLYRACSRYCVSLVIRHNEGISGLYC